MIACAVQMVESIATVIPVSGGIEPEGYKVFWALMILIVPVFQYLMAKKVSWDKLLRRANRKHSSSGNSELTLSLDGEPDFRPIVLYLRMTNRSNRVIDINAPVIVFKRWRSARKFKIRRVNESEIYPLLLDPNLSHELTIQLEPFYRKEPILRNATRVRVEVGEVHGKKRLKSRFVRLKWI